MTALGMRSAVAIDDETGCISSYMHVSHKLPAVGGSYHQVRGSNIEALLDTGLPQEID